MYAHFITCQYFKIVSSNLIENSFLFYQNWCSLARVLTGLHLFITSSSGRKQKTLRMRLLYVSAIHLSPLPFMALFYILSLPLVFLMWESPSLSSLSSNDVTFHWMLKYFEQFEYFDLAKQSQWGGDFEQLQPSSSPSASQLMRSIWFFWKFSKELKVLFKKDNVKWNETSQKTFWRGFFKAYQN